MKLHYDTESEQLFVLLDGEIDHHTSGRVRSELDAALYAHTPRTLILDFQDVTFMDSSGIGLIMGRYKILRPLGGEIILLRPAPHIKRILRLAGMERLAKIQHELGKEVVQ
ncbi:MAG: STAS domain-containing protein [Ruminococcus sp.]|nr:STAS domain-containing protein [Ruminococcus sp.]